MLLGFLVPPHGRVGFREDDMGLFLKGRIVSVLEKGLSFPHGRIGIAPALQNPGTLQSSRAETQSSQNHLVQGSERLNVPLLFVQKLCV
jgi:hypothetical protein